MNTREENGAKLLLIAALEQISSFFKAADREGRSLKPVCKNYPKLVLAWVDPIQMRSGVIRESAPKLIASGHDSGPGTLRESNESIGLR